MRQYLYPLRQARYVVGDELKELKQRGASVQRDSTFQNSVKKLKHDPTIPKEAVAGALKRVASAAIDKVLSEAREPSQKKDEIVCGAQSQCTCLANLT